MPKISEETIEFIMPIFKKPNTKSDATLRYKMKFGTARICKSIKQRQSKKVADKIAKILKIKAYSYTLLKR